MQDFYFKYAVNDTYMAVFYQGDEQHVTVPSSYYGKPVSILYDNLFQSHAEIVSVTLPDTLSDIGGFVFDGCTGLKEIVLPDHITVLWQYAFVRSSFTSLHLPQDLKSLYPYTFKDCRDLEVLYCNASLKEISRTAFSGCTALKEIHLSRSTRFDPQMLQDCPAAEIIYY
ncbi:MAG: leucine-rich repeat domain-containing protein [Erysipelotrichaceae bacterium]|nr:leucine-rich repeat domain-containing protein [Erysipelotrichaceae bacterium]